MASAQVVVRRKEKMMVFSKRQAAIVLVVVSAVAVVAATLPEAAAAADSSAGAAAASADVVDRSAERVAAYEGDLHAAKQSLSNMAKKTAQLEAEKKKKNITIAASVVGGFLALGAIGLLVLRNRKAVGAWIKDIEISLP